MKINVADEIVTGTFTANDNDFYKKHSSENPLSLDGSSLETYNKDLNACSDNFKELYAQAERAGIQLQFVEELNDDGNTVYKISDESIKKIDEVNLKYREGTVAAKLYAKAQEAQAKAAALSSKSIERQQTKLISSLWNRQFDKDEVNGFYAMRKDASAADKAKVSINALGDSYKELASFLKNHKIVPSFEDAGNGVKKFSQETLAKLYKIAEVRDELLNKGDWSGQDVSDAIEANSKNTSETRKLELLQKMKPEMRALVELADELGVKLQFKDPIKGMSELDDATKQNLGTTKKVDAATVKATAAGKAHNAMLALKAGLYKGAAAAANLFGVETLKELGKMALLTVGISLAVKGIQKLWSIVPTQNHLLEWAEESANALQETRDEIDSTTEELDSIQERMTELQNMGALSLTEQEELRKLQQQNAELEKKLAILKQMEEIEAREAARDAVRALHGYDKTGQTHVTNYGGNGASTLQHMTAADQLDEYAAKYREIKAEMADLDLSDPDAKEEWEELNAEAEKYHKLIVDDANKYQTQLDNIPDLSLLDEEDAAYAKDISNSITNSLQTIGALSSYDAFKLQIPEDQYDSLIQKMQLVADSEEEITKELLVKYLGQDLYDSAVTAAGGFDSLKEHILSLRGTEKVLDIVLNSSSKKLDEFSVKYQEALKGGNVDLYHRPSVSGEKMREAGWDVPKDSTATVYSMSASAESGDDMRTVVVTPILPDGTVLSEGEMQEYMDKILAGEDVGVDIELATFYGADSIEKANEFSEALHEAHEDFYVGSEDILPNDVANEVRRKIQSIVSDKDFDINKDSLKRILPQEFFDALEKGGGSIDAFIEKLKKMQNPDVTMSGAVDELATIEDKFKTVGTAYSEFVTDGTTSISTLKSLSDAFKDAIGDTDEFSNAIKVLSNSKSSTEDAQRAVEKLIDSYMNSSKVLSNLTDETKGLYIAQLKKIGVTNAEEVANFALARATLASADADAAAKQAAAELIGTTDAASASLYTKAYYALSAAQQEEVMKAVEESISGSNFASVMANHADALYALAGAAGYTAQQIASVAAAYSAMASLSKINPKNMTSGQALEAMRNSQQISNFEASMQDAFSIFNNFVNTEVDVPKLPGGGPGSSSSPGSGGGSGDSPSDKRKNKYDEEKAKLDHKLEMEYISYKTYYKKLDALGKKYLKGRKGNAKDYKEHLETLADVRKSAFDAYKKQLDTSLEKGKLSYDKYYKKVIALGKKWLKGKKGNKEDYQEYINDLIEIRRDAFKAGQEDLDKSLEKQDISISTYYSKSKKLQKKWLADRDSTKKDLLESIEELFDQIKDYYEDLMDKVSENNEIKTFYKTWVPGENEVTAWEDYIKEIDQAQLKGMLRWEDWYDMRFKAEKELADARKEAFETEKDSIDNIIDLVSDMLKQEKEDMIDALNDQKDKYAEIVAAKKEALDLTRAQLDYEKEIRDLNRDLSDMQSRAAVLRLDTSREGQAKYKALMEEIRQKQEEIAEKQDDHAYDASIEALDESLEDYEEKLEKKIEDIEELMNHQGEWLKYVYSYINSTDPSTLLNRLVGYNDQYGTGIAADVHDMWANYENVRNKYLGEKVEDIIAAIREAAKAAENGSSEEMDYDGDGVADDSANYKYIGKMILQMEDNLREIERLKGVDTEEARNKVEQLKKSNLLISHKIADTSSGTFDDLDHNKEETKWYTKTGANLFDMIAHGDYVPETRGMTAVSVINMMKKEKDKDRRNLLAKELRTIHGYENVFYDYDTGYWYKNATDYQNQKALFDKEGNAGTLVSMPQTLEETIDSIKKAMSKGSWGSNSLNQLVKALRKYSGYGNAWYDPSTKHVYKNATDFYNLQTVDAGKVGTYAHAAASRIINAMKSSGSADVNNALASILKKNFKAYKDLYYDKTSKKWKYTKNKKKVNLYHTGLDAGFVSDGSYLPSPKQSELYALLQKGELVLNKTDQDRLMVQMQVLSGLQDSIKKMTQTASAPAGISAQPIIINLDQPIIINGNADKSTVDLLKKQSQAITNQTLNTLQDALKMRGFNGRVQSNRK